jgi:hypothetical protein
VDTPNGLLYPASYLSKENGLRLAQLFREFTLLAPAEDEPQPYPASISDHVEVTVAVPAPLGDRLASFNRIIKDWHAWARDMGLGRDTSPEIFLQSASLERNESITEIISSLKGPAAEDPLLDARLFLRLAADLDRKEDELSAELAQLEIQQGSLRSILQGPDAGEPTQSSSERTGNAMIQPISRPKERLRAWARLWREDRIPGLWPVGESISIKDMMDQAYEALEPGQPASELLRLPLPLNHNIRPGHQEQLTEALSELMKALSHKSDHDAGPNSDTARAADNVALLWAETVQRLPTGPTIGLTVYPKRTWEEVMLKAVGEKDASLPDSPATGFSFYLY